VDGHHRRRRRHHEGRARRSRGAKRVFGVAIRLPFETTANEVISGDEKLIRFRYFFTRKLMFMSQSDAVVLFPGGFGTQDEAFETLTLIQTGKATDDPDRACSRARAATTGATGTTTSGAAC
jgi:predicted Rossmann-fold nucleotide-binding protein